MSVPAALRRRNLSTAAAAVFLLAGAPSTVVTTAAATPAGGCPVASVMKPLIRGLVDRHVVPPAAGLQASAIDVKWSDLEPGPLPGLVHPNSIDVAIAAAGCTTPLRLRILAGISAPDWVKNPSGVPDDGPVSVTNPFDGSTGTIGRFWNEPFKNAYDNLHSELAAAYDSMPNLYEVVVSRCTMFYAEPFLRGTSSHSNITNLLAAGYTVAADQLCQTDEIDSLLSRWTTTRIGVSFNPYQVVNPTGPPGVDEAYTEQVMAYCRNTYGRRCVLENDSIRDPISGLTAEYGQMYAMMVSLGGPLAFQTAVKPRYGDFWGTLLWARQHHAASVELPVDGTYPTSGGAGAPAWQTLDRVAPWFQEDPALTGTPLSAVEGSPTTGMTLANLTLDETAAVDTIAGYGDVGSVPFDTVTAQVGWPDGAAEAALLTTGQGGAAPSVTCPQQQLCTVTIQSGGHTLLEEGPASPAAVAVSLGYTPADGVPLALSTPASVSDAVLSLLKMRVERTHTPKNVRLTMVFADSDPGGLSSDYTVTITWGDTSTSVIPATAVLSGFQARISHVYASRGTFRVDVGVLDAGGAALTARRSITVN